jgi:competence protein ComEC
MHELSAPNTEVAPLEPAHPFRLRPAFFDWTNRLEGLLERERSQLPPWFAVAIATGIAAWFALPGPTAWFALLSLSAALVAGGFAARLGRIGRVLAGAGVGLALGCGLVWLRSERVAAPRLERPTMVEFEGRIEKVEPLAARGAIRLTVATNPGILPPRVRVSVDSAKAPTGLAVDSEIKVKARMMPPPAMAFPGSHDFGRDFWFKGIGAVGRAVDPPTVTRAALPQGIGALRARLDSHVRGQLPASSGSIATALATGDQHAVSEADAEAMRRSGLTHLLSVSGLHIAAVVGAAMLLSLKLLALSERLALRFNLVLVSAGVGALAGIFYTLLTGMQVPTVRSCIAALLVLGGIALGRDALSMRLIAVGALVVMVAWPEAVAGASFQMSFAAVTAIVAAHSSPRLRALFAPREQAWGLRLARSVGSLFVAGLAVEIALTPLVLYHFHRAGLYGVAANLLAIPWTTFVVMPLEAAALAFDAVGLGAPFWTLTGWSIDRLLGLAHYVAGLEGAVASIPAMPRGAFALMVGGGLWLALWQGRMRLLGLAPFAAGALWTAMTAPPDIFVTGDGRNVVIIDPRGAPAILRERSGDYVRGMVSEAAGFDGEPLALREQPFARCSDAACVAVVERGGRRWTLLATRSRDFLKWREMIAACAAVDIVVSDRRLPPGCTPRWLKLDRPALTASGGVAIRLGDEPRASSVAGRIRGHPWAPGQ